MFPREEGIALHDLLREDIKHYQRIGYKHNQPRGTVAQSTKIVTHCLGIHAMIASSIFTDCSSQSNTYNRLLIK